MGTFVTVCLHFRTCTYRTIRYLSSDFTTLPRGILLARLFRSQLPNFEDLRPVHRDIEHAWRTLIQRGIRREFPRITFYNGYEPWQVRQRLDLFFPGEVFTFRENLVVAGALQEVDEIEEASRTSSGTPTVGTSLPNGVMHPWEKLMRILLPSLSPCSHVAPVLKKTVFDRIRPNVK